MMARHAPSKVRPGWQEERRLLAAVKNEDEKALDRFTRDHGATLYRLAYRLCRDEERALQILTSALTRAFQQSGFRREDQELGPWLAGFILRQAMPVPPGGTRKKLAPGDGAGGQGRDRQELGRQGRGRRGRGRRGRPQQQPAPPPATAAPKVNGPAPVVDWSLLADNEDTRRELRQRLQLEANRLPVDLRSAWILLDAEGRPVDQSAAALELDRATILSRLHRARMLLCASLTPKRSSPEEAS